MRLNSVAAPVATTTASAVPHRLRGAFGPELVHEPEADRRSDDHSDDDRVERLAHHRRRRRRRKQQPQQRTVQLASQHRPHARMMGPHRVRPKVSVRSATSVVVRPDARVPSALRTCSVVEDAAVSIRSRFDGSAVGDEMSGTPKYGTSECPTSSCGSRSRLPDVRGLPRIRLSLRQIAAARFGHSALSAGTTRRARGVDRLVGRVQHPVWLTGDCCDNGQMASFWARMQVELREAVGNTPRRIARR